MNIGYAVTGNRNQNYSKFRINDSGFNSYREFNPSYEKEEIAIVGDSYIQGFHIDYDNSIGKKIENQIEGIEVYEYGYAGYDLANQLHLISAYKDNFDKINHIFIYVKYPDDFIRAEYTPNIKRIQLLSSTVFKIRDNIKLLSYISSIGVVDPIKDFISNLKSKKNTNDI